MEKEASSAATMCMHAKKLAVSKTDVAIPEDFMQNKLRTNAMLQFPIIIKERCTHSRLKLSSALQYDHQ